MPFSAQTLIELKNLFIEHPLFLLGILLLAGYLGGKLMARIGLPEILGFILTGLLASSFTTGFVTYDLNHSLNIITETAIGFLALSIGTEFAAKKMRRIGRRILAITAVHLLANFLVVYLGCLLLHVFLPQVGVGFPFALLLGITACATAPAIIVAEVHHLRAHGEFIDYLFGIIALSDAVAVVLFGIAFTVVTNLLQISQQPYLMLYRSVAEILLSGVCGLSAGMLLHVLARRIKNKGELLILTVSIVFVMTGFSIVLHLSPLLANMTMGAVLINLSSKNLQLFRSLEPLTPPIYALFFIIGGIELNPAIFLQATIAVTGVVYLLLRGLGKYFGIFAGCYWQGCPKPVTKYLGFCMFPQGGIALGFVLLIQTSPALAGITGRPELMTIFANLMNILLISIFLNEILSPLFLKFAITRGNEMEE